MIKGFSQRFNKNAGIFFMPSVVSLCLISTFLALILSNEGEIKNTLYSLLEAAFSFVITYCFINPLDYLINKNTKFIKLDSVSFGVTLFSFYTVFCGISLLSYSIPRITGVLAILLLSYIFNEKGGAVSGTAVGLSSFIAYNDISLGAIFPFSALLTSLFSDFGQAAAAIVFLLSVSLFAYFNPSENSVPLVAQSAAACLIFVLTPKEFLEKIKIKLNQKSDNQKHLKRKLDDIKKSILSVGEYVENMSSELSKIENRDEALKENEKCTELRRALTDSFFTSADILNELSNNDFKEDLKTEKIKYKFDTGVYQETGGESRHCGDSIIFDTDKNNFTNVILSDGMGTGARAAVDSQMTVIIFNELIKSGTGKVTALKLLNAALIAKSQDETLATLDSLSLNPYSSEIEFFKAGAAPSFILKGDKLLKIELMTLPVGILRDVKFQNAKLKLSSCDRIIMLSDGALTENMPWLEAKIRDRKLTAQALSEEIARCSRNEQKGMKKDDLTVAVIDVKKA